MEARHFIGITVIIIGVALQPYGWIYYYPAQIASFILIVIGVSIFVTQKYIDAKDEAANVRYLGKRGLPGDTADYKGWGRSGESHSYENFSSDSGGEGGD